MSVNPRAWLAEAIATFALVFFGPLSIILAIAYFEEGLTTMSVLFILGVLKSPLNVGFYIYAVDSDFAT